MQTLSMISYWICMRRVPKRFPGKVKIFNFLDRFFGTILACHRGNRYKKCEPENVKNAYVVQ